MNGSSILMRFPPASGARCLHILRTLFVDTVRRRARRIDSSLQGIRFIEGKELNLSHSNRARDTRRNISKAIRESQQSRMDALDALAQGLTEISAARIRLKELETHVEDLRVRAKNAGNTATDIRAVERIVNELALKRSEAPENDSKDMEEPSGMGDE